MNILQGRNHYKLYKSGKLWVAALIVATGLMTVPVVAHADENGTAPVTAQADQQRVATNVNEAMTTVNNNQVHTTSTVASGQVKADGHQEKTTFDSDQDLHKQLSDGMNLDHQVLRKATIFHIFSKNTGLYADTNGNFATDKLIDNPDFGSRNSTYSHTQKDVYYIGNAEKIAPNGFRTDNNYVILGNDSNVKFKEDGVYVNGTRLDHLKKSDVKIAKGYLDIDNELKSLAEMADYLACQSESDGIKRNFSDMNKQVIDVSGVIDNLIIINIDDNLLQKPQPITIKGLSSKTGGPAVILNVKGDQDIDWQTQIKLVYDDGTQLSAGESHSKPNHVLWNFGTAKRTVNIHSGYLMGSVLVPNGTIDVNVNADGNLIAHDVNIRGGESHRWDLWAPESSFVVTTQPDHPKKQPTTPTNPNNPQTPDKPDTPEKPTAPETPDQPENPNTPGQSDKTKPSKPEQPTKPDEPETPDHPENPDNPQTPDKPTTPDQPDTPDTPDNPAQPDTLENPTVPPYDHGDYVVEIPKHDQPTTPDNPGKTDQPEITDHPKQDTPGTPDQPAPDKPKTDDPSTPTTSQNPEVPTDVEKTPDQPTVPTGTPTESTTSTDVEVKTNKPVKKQSSVVAVAAAQQAKQQGTALPQTGNQDSQLSLFAVLTLSLGGFLSLVGLKKRQK
ncbi:MAG TPA: KxYKxGKxW signal peptide domain-containing protein [Candidatus Limosilactobacillus merdipullorum]|uniref:KxYKxGKxW signal peptide domain-containing protein n=1 Tax=Candidatus Limosilactobacillus merdipullorum TaxID=2838653 RepID=A0A9D1QPH6_9LACO|nr:KxYKxGKxW signal peptide domain-containing protein [Candidatus Limosilactobacillus merdipullorum]